MPSFVLVHSSFSGSFLERGALVCVRNPQILIKWTARVASDVKEATALIEAGFDYVTGEYSDGGKIFRKRKWGGIV